MSATTWRPSLRLPSALGPFSIFFPVVGGLVVSSDSLVQLIPGLWQMGEDQLCELPKIWALHVDPK